MPTGASMSTNEASRTRVQLGDRPLALLIGVGLFLAVAWPLCFLRIPPYQDLPGHLAAVTILANPDKYPEFVPTGFLKPNDRPRTSVQRKRNEFGLRKPVGTNSGYLSGFARIVTAAR